jgi:hypothetical protein
MPVLASPPSAMSPTSNGASEAPATHTESSGPSAIAWLTCQSAPPNFCPHTGSPAASHLAT